jgi:hypothetical protein
MSASACRPAGEGLLPFTHTYPQTRSSRGQLRAIPRLSGGPVTEVSGIPTGTSCRIWRLPRTATRPAPGRTLARTDLHGYQLERAAPASRTRSDPAVPRPPSVPGATAGPCSLAPLNRPGTDSNSCCQYNNAAPSCLVRCRLAVNASIRRNRSPAPALCRPVIQPLAADSGHKETGMSFTVRLR